MYLNHYLKQNHNLNLNFHEKLFFIDPNKFEFFLFKVLFIGIKFSSLSLNTVANLNSKYLFISSNFFFIFFIKTLINSNKVKDFPSSKVSLKPNLFIEKILSTLIFL